MRRRTSLLLALALSSLVACGSEPNDAGSDGTSGRDGQTGSEGSDGATGEKGKTSLIRLDDEPAGSNCPHGGTAVKSGTDKNDNGVLEDDEVTSTQYVCSGGVVGDVTISSPEGVQALAGIRHLVGMLTIEGGLTGDVVLPDIEVVEGKILVTGALGSLKMPKLQRAGGVSVTSANEIVSIELPRLEKVGGGISLGNNPLLETVDLPALTTSGGFFAGGNPALETLTLPSLTEIGASGLAIGRANLNTLYYPNHAPNPTLKTFSAPKLKKNKGALTVQANEFLDTLDLKELETVTGGVEIGNHTWEGEGDGLNRLQSLSLPRLESVGEEFTIYYLPALESVALDSLAEAKSISFYDLPLLESLSLPALKRGRVGATSLSTLHSFTAPQLISGGIGLWQNPRLASVSAPLLASGSVSVQDNTLLESLSLPKLTTAEGLSMGGPALKDVKLPLLTKVEGTLSILSSAALETVELLTLTTIEGGLGVGTSAESYGCSSSSSSDRNSALSAVRLPALTSIGKHLCLANNDILESFILPELASIGGTLGVATYSNYQTNPALKTFAFPKLTSLGGDLLVGSGDSNAALNPLLETFELPLLATIGGKLQIGRRDWSSTNPLLESFDLGSLRKVKGTDFLILGNVKLPTCVAEALYEQLDAPRPANKELSGNLNTCP